MKLNSTFFTCLCATLLTQVGASPTRRAEEPPEPYSNFVNNVVYRPGPGHFHLQTLYARTLQLKDGSHLLTWENYGPEPPLQSFPILKSEDGGASWSNFSKVEDQINGWGNRFQPHLYRLENDLGEYVAGTIILGGMSVQPDLKEAWLDVYTSSDEGETWTLASQVVYAPGPETTKNGDKAVWEPFFLEYQGKLVCFYSTQKDDKHGQKLAHVTTTDLKKWSDEVNDVADPIYERRPGMTTVAHIKSTGKYIMTYEICGVPEGGCPSYFKVADSPLEFDTVQGHKIIADTGENPGSAPYIIWTPHPKKDDGSGVILMNGAQNDAIYINDDSAAVDGWRRFDIEQDSAHSRGMEIVDIKGSKKLMLASGGHMVFENTNNWVSIGVVDIPF
ncbi:hypothetical protein NM208_g7956 [Fusarium decemcellulare]|uniref:Uncharacterized protein n=1 Tax=Fusarium decemcellulare TaxID=57161 RepID=A0ACC1S793_9HYPO|nr:hypothetical protein NM208_g7956 [Fusarium decemcellulare]